ncbi:complement C3 [Gastrophryne carolinensis]
MPIPSAQLEKKSNTKQFVSVNVKFSSCKLEKIVMISFQSGYIFIQTDKPIYTPLSTINYRLFSMSPNLDPVSKSVIVEFLVFMAQYFLQTTGVAMDARCAPSVANLFLGWWEKALVFGYSMERYHPHIVGWYHFIDDILLFWDGTLALRQKCIGSLNTNNLNIFLTSHCSYKKVEYLDLKIFVDEEGETPNNVVVQKDKQRREGESGIISNSYKLTEPVSIGIWTISAKYEENPSQNYTTNFEVKEYVLPSFEIKLQPSKKFFHYKDDCFKVEILADYVYGKAVSGVAFVLFGVRKGDQHISLTDSLKRVPINDGSGEATLERKDIVKRFSNERDIIGWTLHLQVSVITDTGSDLLEAELDDIHIVEFPFTILFTKTSNYFKPAMPFDLNVLVTNPDGSPAPGVPLEARAQIDGKLLVTQGTTSDEGKSRLSINTAINQTLLPITVSTKYPNLAENQQATTSMTAKAYSSANAYYLHISVSSSKVTLRDNLEIQFAVSSNLQGTIKNIFYLILNKGRVHSYKRIELDGRGIFKETLHITGEHLPSFRIVGYFVTGNQIVADSLWVNIKEDCVGKLTMEAGGNADKLPQRPSGKTKLKLTADYKAHVGLVAVDKAVYALNNKFRLTQSKVWGWIDKFDLGCTAGSGADTAEVFYDAGLVLDTNIQVTTTQRIATNYKDQERECCLDGMKENPMGHSCEQRSDFIDLGQKCIDAFLDCCRHMEKKKKEDKEDISALVRSSSDDDYFQDEDVISRSFFPESFLWETRFMGGESDKGLSSTIVSISLPDSITTWEVMAVSFSKGKGLCVSEPYSIVVLKDVFLDLKLPYSVVRNEQIELRAIIYNYGNSRIKGYVIWTYNEQFCSLSTNKRAYRIPVEVNGLSSVAVPFVIIPLELGPIEVEVKVIGDFSSDGVKKMLRVIPEGTLKVIKNAVVLDPENNPAGKQEVSVSPGVDTNLVVPQAPIQTIVTIQGTPISDMVQQAVDGINLNHLINIPSGCSEQNMAKLAAVVIASYFLDTTNQWDRIGVDRRVQAIQFIMKGISQQMGYRRKEEAAFAGYQKTVASTWLTAYAVRIFALAKESIDMEDGLCDYVRWLVFNKQKPDGVFVEDGTLYGPSMMGGLDEDTVESDSTLTAFVLNALLDAKKKCSDISTLTHSITKALSYIKEKYKSLQKPYSVAITSYVLAKANQLDDLNTLMSKATGGNQWIVPGSSEGSMEATSYALLAILKKGDHKKAEPLANWLTKQRYYGTFYGSTQATIMMFQALAEYQIAIPPKKDMEMFVKYTLPGKNNASPFNIKAFNALVARSEMVSTLYYEIKTEEELECNNFELNVTVSLEQKTASIDICTRFKGSSKPGLSIIEISMLSGFSAKADSLTKLKEGVDKYISHFEINKAAYDKSTVVIYVDKLSNTKDFCINVLADQEFEVGNIQPASVTVYQYYAKENRCTKFYHVDKSSRLLSKICHKDVCRCAEESCFKQQRLSRVTADDRYKYACESDVDYVYVTTVNAIEKKQGKFNIYTMTIKDIVKPGTDGVKIKDKRYFVSHVRCEGELKMKIGEDYLIWGPKKDTWEADSQTFYMITKDSWVELWPNTKQCQEERQYKKICDAISEFAEELKQQGCDT